MGNHESDWPGTSSFPGYGTASGGECSVATFTLLPMPAPATITQPWWSYDIGLIHFIGISTEHNFTVRSPQYDWLERDLMQVNRSVTPWVVLSGHRSMYVSSAYCCILGTTDVCLAAGIPCDIGSDVQVMAAMQANMEPLLFRYRVNVAWAGHFHNLERQTAVYHDKVVQRATRGTDDDGNPCYYHNNPNATVWMVIGSAGNGPSVSNANYSWSEKYWDYMFGYAIIAATNATHLSWKTINSANNDVVDRVIITQNFQPWDVSTPADVSGSGGGGGSGWNSLSPGAQGGIIAAIVIVGVFVGAALALFIRAKTVSVSRKEVLTLQQHSVDRPVSSASARGTVSPLQSSADNTNEIELGNVA